MNSWTQSYKTLQQKLEEKWSFLVFFFSFSWQVARAKAAHFEAVEKARLRNAAAEHHSDSVEVGAPVPVTADHTAHHNIILPHTRLIHSPVASVVPVAHVRWGAPTSSYAYSTVVQQSSSPVVWGAAANLVAPTTRVGHVALVQHTPQGHPLDTPEVAEAKAKHHAAVEEAKARIAKLQ